MPPPATLLRFQRSRVPSAEFPECGGPRPSSGAPQLWKERGFEDCHAGEEPIGHSTVLAISAPDFFGLEKTFWTERFGMVVDRFGNPWWTNFDIPRTQNDGEPRCRPEGEECPVDARGQEGGTAPQPVRRRPERMVFPPYLRRADGRRAVRRPGLEVADPFKPLPARVEPRHSPPSAVEEGRG
jgi:hypothetical protein